MSSTPKAARSDFDDSTVTFTGHYYKKGSYAYEYVPRSVDAGDFLDYRIKYNLRKRLREFSSRGLAKEQRQKDGGLLSVNIPLKSKAIESLFGEGGAGLKVSGYHQIVFSGRSQWDDRASTASYRQNKFPSLNMEQISRFDINGTIGTKISVSVSQDSKTDIPLANRIMLRYKGEEDDIIKTIEAGNTNLSLPNTQFVGYSSRIQGLFGIKTTAQLGGLQITAIASQEKGNTERASINAGASARKDYVRDYLFVSGKIFDLGDTLDYNPGDVIENIQIYAAVNSAIDNGGIEAEFYYDPRFPEDTVEYSSAFVRRVDSNFYIDETEHWVLFDIPNAGTQYEIGVWMTVKRASGVIDTIGDISSVPYQLKLIKHKEPMDPRYRTWGYIWRNVYFLGSQNIDVDGLDVKVFLGESGTERTADNLDYQKDGGGKPYIQILKLDRYDASGNPIPDNLADVKTNIIDARRGLLIFPDRTPFAPPDNASRPDSLRLKVVADSIYTIADYNSLNLLSKYYLEVSSRSRAAQVSLGRPNIIEGSERIVLNGRQLARDVDYSIQYDFGQVTFNTDEALDPNADINIDFEYSPFITAEKKTLFGIRGEYDLSENLKLGSTFLYKSDKATDRKPKVGQETTRMIVWDIDGSLRLKPNFLSKAADLLPFYAAQGGSSLALSGEVAQSYPNPNVDGVAYLDDFEGSRDAFSLGMQREMWNYASKPVGLIQSNVRARMVWYNPWVDVATDSIWSRELKPGEAGTKTLWLEFPPSRYDRRVAGNYADSVLLDPTASWAGIMRYMSVGSANQERAQLLELRVKGEEGILHIDLGNISEDINGNDTLNTEDSLQVNGLRDNILDSLLEDRGLDGKFDEGEYGYNGGEIKDPHDDNWYYNGYGRDCGGCGPNDYSHINGTEGNASDHGRPDSEDLLRNNSLDKNNDYFSFQIDLSNPSRFYVDSSYFNGWRTWRIPIRDSTGGAVKVGSPSWTQINFVRIWVESPRGDSLSIKIAAADLIQSNWSDTVLQVEKNLPSSSKFQTAVINTQENTNYRPPPGVSGNYDRQSGTTEPEQSLLLKFDSLLYNDTGLTERFLYDTPSLVGYSKLKMYVHGPDDSDSLLFFFRVGQDNANFYEFRTRLEPGWSMSNEVNIDFNEITGDLKEYYQKGHGGISAPVDTTAGRYRVFGLPNLTKIKYLACGVINLDSTSLRSGEIWVDELRLTEVRRDVGFAGRLSVSGNVADLFSYGAGYNYRNSYFRGLSTSTRGGSQDNLGSGRTNVGYNFNVSFNIEKFLPRSLGANLPVSMRYSKTTDTPILRFGTDIILPEELRSDENTINVSKGLNVSESFNMKTKNPLFTILLNRLKTNFSYNRSESSSPASPMSLMETYHIAGKLDYNIGKVPSIRPFFWTQPIPIMRRFKDNRFYFFPYSLNLSGDFDRNLRVSENAAGGKTDNLKRDFRGTLRSSYKIADNLTSTYSFDTRRDMSDPGTVKLSFNPSKFKLGRETNYSENFGISYTPKIFAFLEHKFNFTTGYREDRNVNDSTRNIGASKSYSISGNLNMRRLFGEKGKPKKQDRGQAQSKGKVIKVEKEGGNPLQPVLEPIASVMRFLTGWINPISYEFGERYSYSYTGLLDRAQLKFRFGLTEQIGARIDRTARATGISTATSKNTTMSFGTGTELFGGIKADVSFSRATSRDIIKPINRQKSVSTTFPDIRFNIRPLTTFKLFNPIITRFSPRTGYNRVRNETFDLGTGIKLLERTTISYRPLLSFNFDIIRGMQLSVNTDRSTAEEKNNNSQTGAITSRKKDISTSYSFNLKYSFTAPTGIRFPLLGRIKFSSTMSLAIDVTLRKQKTLSANGDRPLASTGERSDFQVSPNISYSFSSQIRGGLSARWQDTNDISTQRKSHMREIRIWVEIRF